MRQEHEEPIRSFYACLKGQAGTCKYEMKCTKADCGQINDFTEEILCNVITRGIADQDIQLDLLGEKNQNIPLKDMIEYIKAKESGKRLASHLLDTRPQTHSAALIDEESGRTPKPKEAQGQRNQRGSLRGPASTVVR